MVRLHSMTTPRDNRALASLCGVLNSSWTSPTPTPNSGWCWRPHQRQQSRDNYRRMSGALNLGSFYV